jgi:arginyl-tRNA synthetase
MIKDTIHAAVKEALIEVGAPEAVFTIERPASLEHGDYATNAALAVAKTLKENPREVAERIVSYLKKNLSGIEKIEVAGAGFVNFFIDRQAIVQEIFKAAGDERWGSNELFAGKEILVEYTSPNLFKPLHIGNLIGNVLGESISRIFELSGAAVRRLNYPSDIGLTVAKGVWGLKEGKFNPENIAELGAAYVRGNTAYESGTEKEKQDIEEINKKLYEASDAELNTLRQQGIETSRRYLDELCNKLGTTFDKEFFESESGPLGRDLVKKNIGRVFEESDGAVVYRGEAEGLHTRVFLNSAGLPTYEAKELGLFALKQEAFPHAALSITVTGSEQKDFFKVVFAAIKKIYQPKTELRHIANSFLRLTTGKMSSRLGNVITGESLLADLTEAARGLEAVAVGALKYAALKQGSGRDIIFDPEKSLSLEGDSGPYLQYARVRARSLIEEAQKAGINPDATDLPAGRQARPELERLQRTIIHFPEVLARAAVECEPHHLTTYLTELAGAFNSWYGSTRVINGPYPSYGLLLTQAIEATLRKGLWALGIPAPEEM